jgi:hypothetical protein
LGGVDPSRNELHVPPRVVQKSSPSKHLGALGCKRMRLLQSDSVLTPDRGMLTSSTERCYMRFNVQLLVGVLLLSATLFASPRSIGDRYDRDRKPHHSLPEPGSMVMLTLTAGTLVGGLFVRRRLQANAVR